LPGSNDSLRAEVLDELRCRFGVPDSALAHAEFTESARGEIWIASNVSAGRFGALRPPGLRAFRRTPGGLKPTSVLLTAIGPLVASSRVEVDARALHLLLLGQRIPVVHTNGYVALSYSGDVVGCALVTDGIVHCLIPTGRRRELLDTLDATTGDRSPEV
jgi:hypothetical protein